MTDIDRFTHGNPNISQIKTKDFKKILFEAAKNGDIEKLGVTLKSCEDIPLDVLEPMPISDGSSSYVCLKDYLLNNPSDDGTGLLTTPLIIAARNGKAKIVKALLEHHNVSVEQTGMVEFSGHPIIKGATPLWCAASIGHMDMVQMLVENFNAEVDHPTVTNSTPLRPACFDGFIDVVRYLVSKGASVNTPTNYYTNTCLLIASYNGHAEVVRFLLEHGAKMETQDFLGQTALHNAAERGHMEIAKVLINQGAQFIPDKKSLTPLHVACDFNHLDLVDYFLSLPNQFSRVEHIHAMELLAASFANGSDNYNIDKCYDYFVKAMEMRYSDTTNLIVKEVSPSEKVFNNQVECQTMKELEGLKQNEDKLNTESLLVKERIFGRYNLNTLDLIYRGAVLADRKDYDGCMKYWDRAAEVKKHNNESISQDLERYGELFSEMIEEVGVLDDKVDPRKIIEILSMCVEELKLDKVRLVRKQHDSEIARVRGNIKTNMYTSLFLINAILVLSFSKEEHYETKKLVYQLVKVNPTIQSNYDYSLLHVVCDMDTEMNEYFVQTLITSPNISLVDVLTECGANPNIKDRRRNTPLHILCMNCRIDVPDTDHVELKDWRECCSALLERGAHIDYRNSENKMPIEYGHLVDILSEAMKHRSLKCLAACAVKSQQVSYKDKLPEGLEIFVDNH